MLQAKFTEFRSKAKYFFGLVEKGEVVRILRNGKAIADITPVNEKDKSPSWKKPGVGIKLDNIILSDEILKDRSGSV